ncbi:hypothetical protein [Enemella sp. A6]|uniref:hypothetical protein n=1 Tax=Enemella sp. A6 TaxID=3440152 RepID=UPI003EBD1E7E
MSEQAIVVRRRGAFPRGGVTLRGFAVLFTLTAPDGTVLAEADEVARPGSDDVIFRDRSGAELLAVRWAPDEQRISIGGEERAVFTRNGRAMQVHLAGEPDDIVLRGGPVRPPWWSLRRQMRVPGDTRWKLDDPTGRAALGIELRRNNFHARFSGMDHLMAAGLTVAVTRSR